MNLPRDRYVIGGVDLADVRNRNETRVADAIRLMLEEYGYADLDMETILNTYAYALNQLPARYAQQGTIILGDPVRPNDIRTAVENALHHVINSPKS